MLTRSQFAELASKAQVDPKQLIEQLFVVQTKQLAGQQPLAKLIFNRAQQKVHDAVLQKRQAGEPPRVICLKARQPGISTLGCGYVGATALCSPYSQSMIVAHLEEASVGLFKKIQFMYDRLPPDFSPKRKASRREEMRVDGLNCSDGEVQLNTAITVATASGGELWRGRTLQTVHLSEFSAFPRADSVLVGIMQAVPPTPQSLVVIESTARGMGNAFHEEWTRAVANESDFVPVFIGWWEIPEYRMPISAEFSLEPEEKELKKALGLTNEQIQWRRYVLFTQCRGSEDYFNQEYPLSPGVAFLTTGRPAFNTKVLQEMYDLSMKFTPERGEIHEAGFSPNRHRHGNFTVYRRPESGHDYTVGADPSAGVEGGDPAAIQVLDRTRMEQVAVWHGLAEPIRFAQIINHVGRWYNNAMVAPELNGGWGFSVVEELTKGYQYPRIYIWQRVDKVKRSISNYYGWWTTNSTRPLLIDSTNFAINEKELLLRDAATIKELLEFQYFDGRRAEGLRHDDLAMAWMIAYRLHLETPMESTGLPPRVRFTDDTAAKVEIPTYTRGIDKDAWEGADQALEGMKRQTQSVANEWDSPDQEPGEAAGFVPDWPW